MKNLSVNNIIINSQYSNGPDGILADFGDIDEFIIWF